MRKWLTEDQVRRIYKLAPHFTQRKIAALLSVSRAAVCTTLSGKTHNTLFNCYKPQRLRVTRRSEYQCDWCEKPTSVYNAQYKKSINHFCSNPCKDTFRRSSPKERLLKHIKVTPTSCWEWTGAKVPKGYGKTSLNGNGSYVHRIMWQIEYGPIPRRMQVCHSCDNPPCINPEHLWLGTAKDNIRDSTEKGRRNHLFTRRAKVL